MRRNFFAVLLLGFALVPGKVQAQAWESPFLMPPAPPPGVGIYLMDVAGGELGAMLSYRSSSYGLGLRGGIAETPGDNVGGFGGIDFNGNIHRNSRDFPLDVDWVFGAGLGVNEDYLLLTVPLGLTLGHTFNADRAVFKPYMTPRIHLDAAFGDQDDDTDLGISFDIGLDLQLSRSRTAPVIRFGASLGDHEAVAVGLVF
jgi:hypothetical protein